MVLIRLEQKNGHLAQIEVVEAFGFICHITTEVSHHEAVPGGVVFFVKLLFHIGHSVPLYVLFLQCLSCTFYPLLLHLLQHASFFIRAFFYQGLLVAHDYHGVGASQ
uniref:Dynein light chain n=1 Tax=Neovison vison TaxID=452646 RepID=A0A8C7AK55_NEOVI